MMNNDTISAWANLIKNLLILVVVLIVIVICAIKYEEVNEFINKVLKSPSHVSVGIIKVTLSNPNQINKDDNLNWVAYYRVKDKIEIREAHLGQLDKEGFKITKEIIKNLNKDQLPKEVTLKLKVENIFKKVFLKDEFEEILKTNLTIKEYEIYRKKILEHSKVDDDELGKACLDIGDEFIEIKAVTSVNLDGAYIGDGNELLYLQENAMNDLHLKPAEVMKIYTYKDKKSLGREVEENNKEILAVCIQENKKKCCEQKGKPKKKGTFKSRRGSGDRIVIFNKDKEILLDLDYWWATEPDTEPEPDRD